LRTECEYGCQEVKCIIIAKGEKFHGRLLQEIGCDEQVQKKKKENEKYEDDLGPL